MKAIHAIWKNGQIVPTQPIDWPDGTTLSIEPIEAPQADESEEDLSGDDPESILRRVAYFEAIPPMRMSATEEAEWQAARRQMKDFTIAKMKGDEGPPREVVPHDDARRGGLDPRAGSKEAVG